jgi:hypothetical protein
MEDVSYVQKEKKVGGMQYATVSHDEVTRKLHSAFLKWRIVSTSDVLSYSQDENRTSVHLEVTFVNVDNTADIIKVKSFGYGNDSQDKGPGKAISYAFKMACLKCFMLETGEDPDNESVEYKKDELITNEQLFELSGLFNDLKNETKHDFLNFFGATYKVSSLKLTRLKDFEKVRTILTNIKNKEKNNGASTQARTGQPALAQIS